MKIAMICAYPLAGVGSGMPYIEGLVLNLSKMEDVEVHVVIFGKENRLFQQDRVTFHVLKRRLRSFLMIASETIRIRNEIVKINPDIVHAQGTAFPVGTAAVLVRKRYPTLLTVHGVWAEMAKFSRGAELTFLRIVAIPLEKLVVSKIPNLITVSHYQRELIRGMTRARFHIIPPGIDFKNVSEVGQGKPLRHPSVLFIGGLLGKRKGGDILLRAVQMARAQCPQIHAYIAGSGPGELELRQLAAELNIEENVDFVGRISHEEKWWYCKSADVFVIPSLWEGMPTVLFEAMMCAKPVVASRLDGIPEVLEDGKTGLLCEPGNPRDLAAKLILLLNNEEMRKSMGNAGEQKAKEYTFDKIAKQHVRLYRDLLNIDDKNDLAVVGK